MDKVTASCTRLHLSNERTLLAWLKLSSIIAAGGFLTRVLEPSQRVLVLSHGLPYAMALQVSHVTLAVVIILLALNLFRQRRALLDSKWLGSYGAPMYVSGGTRNNTPAR